jgi:hypothetical protein
MGATAETSPRLERGVSVLEKGAIPAGFTLYSSCRDPRLLQILFLGALLAGGAWLRDFPIRPPQIILTFAAALGCQGLCGRAAGQNSISWRSAFISVWNFATLTRR